MYERICPENTTGPINRFRLFVTSHDNNWQQIKWNNQNFASASSACLHPTFASSSWPPNPNPRVIQASWKSQAALENQENWRLEHLASFAKFLFKGNVSEHSRLIGSVPTFLFKCQRFGLISLSQITYCVAHGLVRQVMTRTTRSYLSTTQRAPRQQVCALLIFEALKPKDYGQNN